MNKVRIIPTYKGAPEITGVPFSVYDDSNVVVILDKKFRESGVTRQTIPLVQLDLILRTARAEAAFKSRVIRSVKCYVRIHSGVVSVGFGRTTGAVLCYKNGSEILL